MSFLSRGFLSQSKTKDVTGVESGELLYTILKTQYVGVLLSNV